MSAMARQIGPLRALLEYAALVAALAAMERERAVRAGARLGALAMRLDRFDRPIALRNLEIAFPARSRAERLHILRATHENWGRTLAECMHFSSLGPDNIARFATHRYVSEDRPFQAAKHPNAETVEDASVCIRPPAELADAGADVRSCVWRITDFDTNQQFATHTLHQPLIDHRMLDVVLVLMVTTAILGPVLTQYFAPRMLEHVEVADHESHGRGWKGGQPG